MADNNKGGKKDVKKGSEKSAKLGIEVDKEKDPSEWYTQAITKAEMIEYYDVSGCYILRPWSFTIWENIQRFFDTEIKKLGVENAYFPLFISQRALTSEKDHIEGFEPEVAWVTRAGKKPLKEPIAVRPTSETVMYPAYAKWIRSHRDLPLKLNQWCNVVRWEFKHPTPFLRSREFLWQEGHTAFATLEEAGAEVLQILDLYGRVYEDLLAVPVIKGKKTEKEKFPGGYYTTTVECFIPTAGRGIQAATSHCLGQNFAKMFGLTFEDHNGDKQLPWQNSWGLTTRSIGIMILTHGDNNGLILPPRVAPIQVVLVPILFKDVTVNNNLLARAKEIIAELNAVGVRAHLDDRDNYNPGFKYNHWELKGVPIRLEFGPKDFENKSIVAVRRDTKAKEPLNWATLSTRIREILDDIHNSLLSKARTLRDERLAKITKWEEFIPALDAKKMVLAPWCQETECEDKVKEKTTPVKKDNKPEPKPNDNNQDEEFEPALSGSAKSLCMPFDQPKMEEGTCCFQCGKPAKVYCLWGRSY
jgi:prolyl-tRNA synthetase